MLKYTKYIKLVYELILFRQKININAIWMFDKIIFNVWANWIFSNLAKYWLYAYRPTKRLKTPMILRILKCVYIMAYKIDKKP